MVAHLDAHRRHGGGHRRVADDDDPRQGPHRPREAPAEQAVPPLETSPSFPSGHTLNAVLITSIVAYLVLLYVRSRRGRVLTCVGLAGFAGLMGLSRVYLGHHWLTDVLAGAAVGGAWALAVILGHWLYVRLRTKDRAPTVRDVAQDHRDEVDTEVDTKVAD